VILFRRCEGGGGGGLGRQSTNVAQCMVTKVSDDHTASIFTSALKLQAMSSSETPVIMHQTTQCCNPKTTIFRSENAKSHMKRVTYCTCQGNTNSDDVLIPPYRGTSDILGDVSTRKSRPTARNTEGGDAMRVFHLKS
jgi:hypothetical protein